MANTTSQIKIIFDGTAKGVVAAAAAARSAISGLNDENDRLATFSTRAGSGLATVTKGIAALGAAGSAVQVIGGVAGAMVQLAPAALLLPGALLAGGAAMGTFKIATAGLGDALKAGLSGDMAKFGEATKNMAPAMQDAAKAVVAFRPQIDALKKSVQGEFWKGLNTEIAKTANNILPALSREMPGVASGFNRIGVESLRAAQTGFFKSDIQIILSNTADTLKNMGSVAADVVTGFVRLGAAGSSFLPRLGVSIDDVATRFANWAERVTQEGGQFFTWVNGAIQGFKDLAAVAGNIGSILGSVFTGLGGVVASPLASLRELTGELATFLKTAEAQAGLRSLGEVLATAASVMRDVMAAALREIAPLLVDLGPAAKAVAQGVGDFLVGAIRTVGPLLQGLGRFLSDNADSIRAVIPLFLTAAVAIKGLLVAQTVVAGVRALGAAFAFLGTKAGLWAAAIVAATDIAIGAIKGYSQAQNESFAKGGFGDDINTFVKDFKVEPLQAIGKEIRASLTPPAETQGLWQKISSSFQTDFVDVMAAAPGKIKASFQTDFLGVFAGLGDSIGSFFSGLPGRIGGFLSGLGGAISSAASTAWNFLVTTAQTAIESAVTFVTGLPGRIGSALSSLGASIAAAATGAWNSLVTATQTAIEQTAAFVTDLPFKVGFALGSLAGIIASAALSAWNTLVTATQTAITSTVAFVTALPGQIAAGLAALGGIIASAAATAWDSLVSATTTAVTATVAFVTALPGRIGAALASLGSTIVSVATSAWAQFTARVQQGANIAIAFVRSVPGLIRDGLSALAGFLVSTAQTAWAQFTARVQQGANIAIAFVRSVPGLIRDGLSALASLLTTAGTNGWNGFTTGIRNAFNATVAFVRGIPGQIASAVGNLGSLLVGAGRSVIDGLLAGIRAGVNAMYSFVSGIAAGIAARKGPIEYDRKLLIPAGLAIMQGLRSGMQTGLADVLGLASATAGQIADQLSTTVSPTVQMATSGLNLSGPDPTAATLQQLLSLQTERTPVEVTVLLDGQPVRDIARTEITTSSRVTRRTVGMGAGTSF